MMIKIRNFAWNIVPLATVASTLAFGLFPTAAAENQSSGEKQRKLIGVLQSDAPPQEKAITCKLLAIYGTPDAVPALAPLLADENLASWARIALEAIPGPAAEEALRGAMDRLQGNLLVGVINSIGVRADTKATAGLVEKLKASDVDVAAAAAVALGHLGGDQAAQALEKSLTDARSGFRSAVAEGCILCAEKFVTQGKSAQAVKLFDQVRQANLPKQRHLEAIRGAILARQLAGVPLLIEQLRSPDKALFNIGLHTARELNGREVTEALAVELERLSPDRQVPLLLALADRNDPAAFPAVLRAAQTGPKKLRIAAFNVLERSDNIAGAAVLIQAAAESDAELAQAAKIALARLPGKAVDANLVARLPQAAGKMRQVLIELAGLRRADGALPAIVPYAEDADEGVRSAAVQAMGALGGDRQTADLVKLLQKNSDAKERANIEKALMALSSRCGTNCVPYLQPLTQSSDSALRTIALHALACIGGPEALATVKTAVNDRDEMVQDEAVRTLSGWANNWPDDVGVAEPLLALAKTGKKLSHQVLGLRGYLQYVQGDKILSNSEKVDKINGLLPLVQRPEEKRLVIAVAGVIPAVGALEMLVNFAADMPVAEEACSAIVTLASKSIPGASRDQREKALQTVVEKSNNGATKKKAEGILRGLK